MRLRIISVGSDIGLRQPAGLSAAIGRESRHLSAKGSIARFAGARRECGKDPAWVAEISNRTVTGVTWRADGSYLAIDKASLDDPVLVGLRLASADRDLVSAAVDHEIRGLADTYWPGTDR